MYTGYTEELPCTLVTLKRYHVHCGYTEELPRGHSGYMHPTVDSKSIACHTLIVANQIHNNSLHCVVPFKTNPHARWLTPHV